MKIIILLCFAAVVAHSLQQPSLLLSRRHAIQASFGATVVTTASQPALAERSLGTVTESYKRYVPRMEAGFEFLETDLREMIVKGDKDGVIAELAAEKGTKISAMKGTMKVR
jgi:hypothetical protein